MRYLTKSRFTLGLECPTKLYYTGKPNEYADQKFDDPFLQQLASGGFQVGELAKCYFGDGELVETLEYDDAIAKTNELLARDEVTIFEAAFRHENLFIRADIVVKKGRNIQLIEVKAKSWPNKTGSLILSRGGIDADYKAKVADLAFQRYVVTRCLPDANVSASFFFVDKKAECPTDGLHQRFRIRRVNGRKKCVILGEITAPDLDPWIMRIVPADDACDKFVKEMDPQDGVRTFEEQIAFLSEHYCWDKRAEPRPSGACAKCEFKATAEDLAAGLKSGRHECWSHALGWDVVEIDKPNVLNLWDCRTKDKFVRDRKIRFSDLTEADIGIRPDDEPGISRTERQWLQVQMAVSGTTDAWIDKKGLGDKIRSWKFPLHFIDFETSAPAVPFKAGRRPYSGIAFQFSHHTVDENGNVEHKGQFLKAEPGTFPSYDFLRALRDELAGDDGTIFRYADHENSYLNMIWEQLQRDGSVPDRNELCEFIKLISHSKRDQTEVWTGERDMVDMLKLVKRHYYHPATNGSNSIKYVLPAILQSSAHLQEKYSRPYFSRNFPTGQIWVQRDESGKVLDPYKLLDPLFKDASPKDLELLLTEEEDRGGIREGGAAMAAYALLQFEDMTDYERRQIESALLKYCELDTLAMVMIYEAWKAAI